MPRFRPLCKKSNDPEVFCHQLPIIQCGYWTIPPNCSMFVSFFVAVNNLSNQTHWDRLSENSISDQYFSVVADHQKPVTSASVENFDDSASRLGPHKITTSFAHSRKSSSSDSGLHAPPAKRPAPSPGDLLFKNRKTMDIVVFISNGRIFVPSNNGVLFTTSFPLQM